MSLTITRHGTSVRIDATHDELYAWAHRPGLSWPCSSLARIERIVVELDDGDLIDLDVWLTDERYAEDEPDIPADELYAWLAYLGFAR